MRNRVWGSLSNFVFKVYVIDAMVMRYQKYDKRINICLAIVSSSSIAAWTVWQIVPQLWAGMIAITQVIQAPDFVIAYPKILRQRVLLFSDVLPSALFGYKPPCSKVA